jgi:hypothetical protein
VPSIRWARGLRAMVGLEHHEATDEELVAIEIGGETVFVFTDAGAWLAVCETRGGRARVLRAAERRGAVGCARMVAGIVQQWQRSRGRRRRS